LGRRGLIGKKARQKGQVRRATQGVNYWGESTYWTRPKLGEKVLIQARRNLPLKEGINKGEEE